MQDAPIDQEADSTDKSREEPPVWHRPAWITAMVGVVSAFLTVPQVVGDYLAKEQEIEATRIENEGSVQGQALELVQNTLSQQGDERIFMLRYFASTLKDPEARAWAEGEVARLDKLASLQGALDRQRLEIETKEAEIARLQDAGEETEALQGEITDLRAQISQKDLEVSELRQQAGVDRRQTARGILHLILTVSEEDAPNQTFELDLRLPPIGNGVEIQATGCFVSHDHPCEMFLQSDFPGTVFVPEIPVPFDLRGTWLAVDAQATNGVRRAHIGYDCTKDGNGSICRPVISKGLLRFGAGSGTIRTPQATVGIRG